MRKTATVQKVPFLAPDVITKVIPAPTDGWDAISPLAEMDPKRAPILINWVPRPGFVELRGGALPFCNVSSLPVETLMDYHSTIVEKLFAASGTVIYDISTSTAVSAVTGLSSARWQYTNFTSGSGGKYIFCVNGTDAMRQFDGTTWSSSSISGLPGGITTNNFINIYAQKQRLWFIPFQSTQVFFMPVGAITGPIDGFQDFGTLWSKGGFLVDMCDWTVDGGSGPQDYAIFLSSRGQISVYAGTDPINASAWQLVGTFDIAPPIGLRCLTRVGSDVAIITQQGVIPISQALPFDPSADRSVAITARIQNAMAQASQLYQQNFGWEFIAYPNQQLSFLNVPQSENLQQTQFVMNTLTGAWCQFTGWNANVFELFKDNLYYGDNNGNVNLAYAGSSDRGTTIVADMQCAFNWLDEPGRTKRMTMVQPLLTTQGTVSPTIAIDTDFLTSTFQAPIQVVTTGSLWDVATWDLGLWSAPPANFNQWLSVEALGHAHAIRMRVTAASSVQAAFFDVAQFDNSSFGTELTSTLPVLQVNAFNIIAEMGGAI